MKARWGSQAEAVTTAEVGGRGGGICGTGPTTTGGESVATPGEVAGAAAVANRFLVRADRLAIDPRDPLDLSLAGAALQQRPDRCLQMWLQDVHSLCSLGIEGRESNVLLGPDQPASPARSAPHRSTVKVGEFEVARSGGVWVAIRALPSPASPADYHLPPACGTGAAKWRLSNSATSTCAFGPSPLLDLLSRIKGAERKTALKRLIDTPGSIPALLAQSGLTESEWQSARTASFRAHGRRVLAEPDARSGDRDEDHHRFPNAVRRRGARGQSPKTSHFGGRTDPVTQ